MTLSNSRIGYVYCNDDQHFTQDDLHIWLPIIKSLGARWLTLYASAKRAIPEHFLTGVLHAGIEPLILIRNKLGETHFNRITPLLRSYANWGINYVAVYDRPNLRSSWNDAEWNNGGIIDRFLDRTLPILEFQQSVGLKPIMAPIEPGGDYWDTAFLRNVLESLIRRGKSDLLEKLHLGVYAYTHDKPLDWGSGGQSRWPEARPYHTPPNCQDQIGFRTFEWYADLSTEIVGHSLPTLIVAGGAVPDPAVDISYSNAQIEQNVAILRALNGVDIPEYILNFSFYCLRADPDSLGSNSAWYAQPTEATAIVEAMQKVLHSVEKTPASFSSAKSLNHYLLLPENVELKTAFAELSPYIQAHKPILGFSDREARMAHRVTLAGGEDEFPRTLERELRDTGCKVDRITIENRAIDPVPPESQPIRPAIKYSPLGGS